MTIRYKSVFPKYRSSLFLEERISLVRNMLNEESIEFMESLPKDKVDDFKNYINKMLNILDGMANDDQY
jgi:hypothetical protein